MNVLLLTHAFNSLSQRLYVELTDLGHTVTVEYDINDSVSREAVELHSPDLIVAPFLKRAIPEDIWSRHRCLVVHPGPMGDRGPSALDWAVSEGARTWGVTVLEANGEMDGGDVWAAPTFPLRDAAKASIYRNEVTAAAVQGVLAAVAGIEAGKDPTPPDPALTRERPVMRQADRAIDWQADDTATVLRKIRAADGFPGLRDSSLGRDLSLFDVHPEDKYAGAPGTLIGKRGTTICRATIDGAVWIGHLRDWNADPSIKLPATMVLGAEADTLPELPDHDGETMREIFYEERGAVGYLHFPFYNGAMGTEQCQRLLAAYREAREKPTKIIVLMGGPDFWSNGIHLNLIEAADSPADESWRNINAIDDIAREIITTETHLTVAALQGNAGAGGVFLALAADRVVARSGVILNPHYKGMGNLYGSEYWTYLLPRRAGRANAEIITQARLPMGTLEARELGLIDDHFGLDVPGFVAGVDEVAAELATVADNLLADKRRRRAADEAEKPLEQYRAEELERMKLNFYGFDPSYHVARYNFVLKVPKSRTPATIAHHRTKSQLEQAS